ncbi:hypothetical protein ACLB2K_022154 [Fragaria x ananassa]
MASIAKMYLSDFLKHGSPHVRECDHESIFIGCDANKTYQACRVFFAEQIVQDVKWLKATTDMESPSSIKKKVMLWLKATRDKLIPNKIKEKLVVGSGATCSDDIFPMMRGVNSEMSMEKAKAVAVKLEHYVALNSSSTGDPTKESIRFLRLPYLNERMWNVECASFMCSRKDFKYYRVLIAGDAKTIFDKLMARWVKKVDMFEQVDYPLGDIKLEMAFCTASVLQSVANSQD